MPPGAALADLRAARGWTLSDVWAAGGPSPALTSQLERGLIVPQPKHLQALARAYDVPAEQWRIRFVLELEEAERG